MTFRLQTMSHVESSLRARERLNLLVHATAFRIAPPRSFSIGGCMPHVLERSTAATAKRPLLDEILRIEGIATPGLYIVLEGDDLSDHANPKYRVGAFHMDIAKGGIEAISPPHVLAQMALSDCTHLLWVSKQTVEATESRFLWIAAHELHHHRQSLSDDPTGQVNSFIRACAGKGYIQITQLGIPSEFDAEVQAKRTLIALRGSRAYDEYRREEVAREPSCETYFEDFDHREAEWTGDLIEETKQAVRARKAQFEKYLRIFQGHGRFVGLDLSAWM